MKHKILLCCIVIMLSANAYCQQVYKLSLYYATDKYELTTEQKHLLVKAFDSLSHFQINSISIYGNTDNIHDTQYNKKLSFMRAREVDKFLLSKQYLAGTTADYFYGEMKPIATNKTEAGRQKNRRTDIVVDYNPNKPNTTRFIIDSRSEKKLDTVPTAQAIKIDKDSCKDTLISFSQGMQMVIKKCDYKRVKKCLTLKPYVDPDSIFASGLNTMTNRGEGLVSGGMFRINSCSTHCEGDVKIRIPIPRCSESGMGIWQGSSTGWVEDRQNKIKIVKGDTANYYEINVKCGYNGIINLDKKIRPNKNVKIKAKHGVRIIMVKVGYKCPSMVITTHKARYNKHVRSCNLNCGYNNPYVYITALNKNGDTLKMAWTPLSYLQHQKVSPGGCRTAMKEKEGAFMGIFPVWKKTIYHKYYISEADFAKPSSVSAK